MIKTVVSIAIVLQISQQLISQKLKDTYEQNLNFPEYCTYYKYPVQEHQIQTEDGYILKYFRLQSKNKGIFEMGLPVIYLQHGLLDSSDAFIVNSQPQDEMAPAFYFANKGFDVWVGNSRGNFYSRNHISLDPNSKQFWEFSFDEMSEFDLPAAFEYIGNMTNQKINYIGHSQGTMIMFAALSRKDDRIISRLRNFGALGPVAYISNMQSTFVKILNYSPLRNWYRIQIVYGFRKLGIYELFDFNKQSYFTGLFCQSVFNYLCQKVLWLIADGDMKYDNSDRLGVLTGHTPKGTSLQNVEHFSQILNSQKFQKYDYGKQLNRIKYGQEQPPVYDLSQIQFDNPIYFYVGTNDLLADLKDVGRMISQIDHKKVDVKERVIEGFGHLTYYLARDMSYLDTVYDDFGYNN